ncbi:hypothetical protein [Streptomyces sp. NPDC057909]|uniref:hypothetical protein n=1 Tax=Streptomyces sp. NPDC057909 TaxID=3346277 RepID=UPI0036E21E1F
MNHAQLSRARAAVLSGAIALGMMSGVVACSSPDTKAVKAPGASAPAKKLTSAEKQQVKLVNLALGDSDPDDHLHDAHKLGVLVGAKRSGPLRATYNSRLKPGQAVKVDLACTGGGAVTLTVASGKSTETTEATCPDDSSFPEPLIFTADGSRVNVTVTGHGKYGAMGAVVHDLNISTAVARDLILANQARKAVPNKDQLEGFLGATSGSLREGIASSGLDVKKGQGIRIHAACAGTGSLTLSAVSGTAKSIKHVSCSIDPIGLGGILFTAAATDLEVRIERDKGASGGAAYSINNES